MLFPCSGKLRVLRRQRVRAIKADDKRRKGTRYTDRALLDAYFLSFGILAENVGSRLVILAENVGSRTDSTFSFWE